MPIAPSTEARLIEYFILHDARPTGPNIGHYANREIPEFVVDTFGRHYVYVGIAPRKWSGQIDTDALQPGEFIVPPALVYRLKEGVKASWFGSLFRMH